MEPIILTIPGKPIPKKTQRDRVKVDVDWKNKTYTIKRWRFYPQKEEAELVRAQIREQYKGSIIDGSFFVSFVFNIGVPASWSPKQRTMALEGYIYPMGKPDTSNCAKFYEDCMKGIIYSDDSKIIWVCPIKKYEQDSSTQITIRQFGSEDYERFSRVVNTGTD